MTHLFQLQQMKSQHLNRLNHQAVELRVRDVEGFLLTNLFGKHLNVLIEGLRRADITSDSWLTRSAGREFTLFEDQCQEREEWMAVNRILVPLAVGISHAAQ